MRKPWGKLTGVRPTKKARKLLAEGVSYENLPKVLAKEYKISKPKINLLLKTLDNQEIVCDDNVVDFYVNIPIWDIYIIPLWYNIVKDFYQKSR